MLVTYTHFHRTNSISEIDVPALSRCRPHTFGGQKKQNSSRSHSYHISVPEARVPAKDRRLTKTFCATSSCLSCYIVCLRPLLLALRILFKGISHSEPSRRIQMGFRPNGGTYQALDRRLLLALNGILLCLTRIALTQSVRKVHLGFPESWDGDKFKELYCPSKNIPTFLGKQRPMVREKTEFRTFTLESSWDRLIRSVAEN